MDTQDEQRTIFIGGMDAGIEDLLLDAGGNWLVAHALADPPGPWIGLAFAPAHHTFAEVALRACRDHGWPVADGQVGGPMTTLSVQEVVVVRLLHRLARENAAPDTVVVRTDELTAAQVRGIREALPVNTKFHIADR